MDAAEFGKTRRRMCDYYHDYSSCNGCPLEKYECFLGSSHSDTRNDEIVIKMVEQWGEEHPANTRQSEFMKIFPNPDINHGTGAINICPSCMDINFRCIGGVSCDSCKKKYWSGEIE